ncbi:MAG: MaoC family dehydratase [Oligoflexia bacterium]|nr:MaoC family dehydratase [Oligoflexia bacterium]
MKTFKAGDRATLEIRISDEMVRGFAELTGDRNPVHLDAAYAATTPFKKRIAHGMLSASLISRMIASDLPGPGTIYLGQTIKFRKPVFVDETIRLTLTVTAIREDKNILTLSTICERLDGEVVLEGEATVLAPR